MDKRKTLVISIIFFVVCIVVAMFYYQYQESINDYIIYGDGYYVEVTKKQFEEYRNQFQTVDALIEYYGLEKIEKSPPD